MMGMTGKPTWPPYDLLEGTVAQTEARTSRLARIYHVSQEQAWDGRSVLAALIARHGGIHVREAQRAPLGRMLTILLWGELAAWSISAELAERLTDVDAKMAATSQVFDEARHFYVLRDYCLAAGIPLPRLGGLSRKLLADMLETRDLTKKLLGMQLLVENMALVLFKQLGDAHIEPVLTDLLPYYEKDEARHVGLGVLHLPAMMKGLGTAARTGLWWFQLKVNLLSLGGGLALREDCRTLGVDQRAMAEHSFRLQRDVMVRLAQAEGEGDVAAPPQGMFRMSKQGQARFLGFIHPDKPLADLPPTHRFLLARLLCAADASNRYLA